MSLLRIAPMALVLLATACGEEEPVERGVGRGVTTAGSKSTKATPPAKADAAAQAAADAGAPDAEADAAPPPPPEHPSGLIKALGFLAKGRRAMSDERPAAAVKALEQARDAYPDEGWLHVELARACLAAEDPTCALSATGAVIEREEEPAALLALAHLLRARAYRAQGNTAEARAAFERSIAISPNEAVVEAMRGLAGPDAGEVEEPEAVTCSRTPEPDDPWIEAAASRSDARDATICPLDEPFSDLTLGEERAEIGLVAVLKRHRRAWDLLDNQGGLSASGAFPLMLIRRARDQVEVVELDDGRDRARQDEIVSELSAEVQPVILGPSRPGLAVVITTRGWWNVNRGGTPYAFERVELFVVGRHLNQLSRLARQITRETGSVADQDCLFGSVSRRVTRGGAVWLEDLDLSGVPEICQQSTELDRSYPEWMGGPEPQRTEAQCQSWVASSLQRSTRPVPALRIDEFQRERAVREVLDVSHVPNALRTKLRTRLRERQVFLASKGLEIVQSGMHALGVVADETSITAVTANAGESATSLDLGQVGAWREVWADINAREPTLLRVEVTARGNLDGAVERRWLYLIAGGPGQIPNRALQVEIYAEEPPDVEPCPTITVAEPRLESEGDARVLILRRARKTGPGLAALERERQGLCDLVQGWVEGADAGPGPDAGLPPVAGAVCPVRTERLPPERYTQGSDGRFARTTLP